MLLEHDTRWCRFNIRTAREATAEALVIDDTLFPRNILFYSDNGDTLEPLLCLL